MNVSRKVSCILRYMWAAALNIQETLFIDSENNHRNSVRDLVIKITWLIYRVTSYFGPQKARASCIAFSTAENSYLSELCSHSCDMKSHIAPNYSYGMYHERIVSLKDLLPFCNQILWRQRGDQFPPVSEPYKSKGILVSKHAPTPVPVDHPIEAGLRLFRLRLC